LKQKKRVEEEISKHYARKLLHFLSKNKSRLSPLLILTHDYPDPDSISSAFALRYLCDHFKIESKIVYGGIIGRMENKSMVNILKIPVKKLKSTDFRKYKNFALMDTQPGFRNNSFPTGMRASIVIDQHPYVTKPDADLIIVDPDCGATCVILAQALLLLRTGIPANLATALIYGILSDTLNLYRANRSDVSQTYMNVLPYCDLKALAFIQNPSRSRKFFMSLSKGIQNAMVRRGLIITHLGPVESPDLVAQVADFLLSYKRRHWSLCTGHFKGKLHVSLRAVNPHVEAGEVLRGIFMNRGEAGGRGSIAGGSFSVGQNATHHVWKYAEDSIAEKLLKRLRLPVKGDFYYPFRTQS